MSLNDFSLIKTGLASSMWKKHTIKVGNHIYKRRKHKLLNILTLTHPKNMLEIKQLEDDNISKKGDIVGWNCEYLNRMRLETEGIIARGGTKFEDTVCTDQRLKDDFHFDIVNLDYTSQSPAKIDGRFEKELLSVEHVIINLRNCLSGKKNSLILFTTMINTCNVITNTLIQASKAINLPSEDLIFSRTTNPMVDPTEKIETIVEFYDHLQKKYDMTFICREYKTFKLDDSTWVHAIASQIEW